MDDLVERWPGYNEQSWAQRFAELDRRFRKERDTAVKAICQLSEQQSARITDLETALAYSERRVIAEVVAWLRNKAIKAWGADTADTYLNEYAATALETGEWKK